MEESISVDKKMGTVDYRVSQLEVIDLVIFITPNRSW